jgi:hypothetical protein
MRLTLTTVDSAVLLRCLSYGESAISENERRNGTDQIIIESVRKIRTQLAKNLSSQVIASATNSIE